MKKKKKKEKVKKVEVGVTSGGPTPGVRFKIDFDADAHVILLSNNPHYCAAVYIYVPKLTPFGEMVAKFSHYIERTTTPTQKSAR